MARSLPSLKLVTASVADLMSLSVSRRGYAAAAHGTVSGSLGTGGSSRGVVGKMQEWAVIKDESDASSAWAPDPITGYYRPANCADEIDPADLREMLLNHKVKPH